MTEAFAIRKEDVTRYEFSAYHMNRPEFEVRELNRKLYLAMLLGNNFQNKVKIVFNTIDGLREVMTTVWAATETYIILKSGVFIPVRAIADVELE